MKMPNMSAGLVSPRKLLSMGKSKDAAFPKGNFGVANYASEHGGKPVTSRDNGMMMDAKRAIGMPVKGAKGNHGAQAAPDHGAMKAPR